MWENIVIWNMKNFSIFLYFLPLFLWTINEILPSYKKIWVIWTENHASEVCQSQRVKQFNIKLIHDKFEELQFTFLIGFKFLCYIDFLFTFQTLNHEWDILVFQWYWNTSALSFFLFLTLSAVLLHMYYYIMRFTTTKRVLRYNIFSQLHFNVTKFTTLQSDILNLTYTDFQFYVTIFSTLR